MNEETFFQSLADETKKAFQKSPVKIKQDALGRTWSYSICATPIRRKIGVICGLNWGGGGDDDIDPETNEVYEYAPQTKMPDGADIKDYRFVQSIAPRLSDHLGVKDPSRLNYSNLCFFRSPQLSDLQEEDWLLSLPLFRKYVDYIDPPWLIFVGASLMDTLLRNELADDYTAHVFRTNRGIVYSYSGALRRGRPFACVPHPQARLSTEAKQALWTKACEGMRSHMA